MTPKVSILVPVYNVAPYIERCAHSLFRQTFESLEFIFVNDASLDNSIDLLENVIVAYPQRKDRVRIIQHATNKGIGATRNTLLHEATGEYLMWVDSDDFLVPNAVELLYEKAATEEADIITTDCYYAYRGEEDIKTVRRDFPTQPHQYIEALALRQTRAALWGTLSRHDLWSDNRIWMIDGINYGEDYFTTVRLFYFAHNLTIIHQPIYYYNQLNGNSYSSGHKGELHFQSIEKLFIHLQTFFDSRSDGSNFHDFLANAKQMERGALLLHTTASLRRKYATLYRSDTNSKIEKILPFSSWQRYLLKQIFACRFITADVALTVAKLLRLCFHINF